MLSCPPFSQAISSISWLQSGIRSFAMLCGNTTAFPLPVESHFPTCSQGCSFPTVDLNLTSFSLVLVILIVSLCLTFLDGKKKKDIKHMIFSVWSPHFLFSSQRSELIFTSIFLLVKDWCLLPLVSLSNLILIFLTLFYMAMFILTLRYLNLFLVATTVPFALWGQWSESSIFSISSVTSASALLPLALFLWQTYNSKSFFSLGCFSQDIMC